MSMLLIFHLYVCIFNKITQKLSLSLFFDHFLKLINIENTQVKVLFFFHFETLHSKKNCSYVVVVIK